MLASARRGRIALMPVVAGGAKCVIVGVVEVVVVVAGMV